MTCRAFVRGLAFGAVLALPVLAYGQETVLSGSVVDATDAVLPGVTVTAVHVDSGNTFTGVTDERGAYRVGALRPGAYRITAELAGFTTAVRENVQLLLGQRGDVDFELTVSTVQETVTVTSEAPLVETSLSKLGGNIDPRQMQELPVNGRNWMDLTMLAPGSRTNAVVAEQPATTTAGAGFAFQINLDGQQMTNTLIVGSAIGQVQLSRDAIGEFEFIANRFDATQGRSSGVQVNAITKSGTNNFAGTASGYFRSDKFNAADFITRTVLPYSNQQLSAVFGGPIRRDRVHFLGSYEYERQPQTFVFTSPWPSFNTVPMGGAIRTDKGVGKVDVQFNNSTRLMGRVSTFNYAVPFAPHPALVGGGCGATAHPSSCGGPQHKWSTQEFVSLTQVFGQSVNELKGGYNLHQHNPQPTVESVLINFRGYSIGGRADWPQHLIQRSFQIRDDFTFSAEMAGRHEFKVGGDYMHLNTDFEEWAINYRGVIDATGGPVPANIEALFPVWNDPSTWNLAALSPITVRFMANVPANPGLLSFEDPKEIGAAWVQDNWSVMSNLTLNLGVRWDVSAGALAEDIVFAPFLPERRPHDWNNIQPRFGFAYTLPGERTVLRGGFGKYFPELADSLNWSAKSSILAAAILIPNDGRPDFAANPYGPAGRPTFAQQAQIKPRNLSIPNADVEVPSSWQGSFGVQQQLGSTMSVQADYVYQANRHESNARNANLSYNPVTGANYPFTDVSRRPYAPDFGSVSMTYSDGYSNDHNVQMAFTKRFSQRWQGSATYTLGFLKSATGAPTGPCFIDGGFAPCPAGFKVPPDLGGEYTYAVGDQRHRAVLNGIWQVGYGFQLSGLYFFGSGERFSTSYGADLRVAVTSSNRLRPDGSIVPRNNLVGTPLHRVDLRLQRSFPITGRLKVDGILEVFNLFNHENYGSFVTVEASPLYGRPTQNTNVAYLPRMLQLGFRVAF